GEIEIAFGMVDKKSAILQRLVARDANAAGALAFGVVAVPPDFLARAKAFAGGGESNRMFFAASDEGLPPVGALHGPIDHKADGGQDNRGREKNKKAHF